MIAASPIDPDAQDAVRRLGRSALAWEVLRRDPAYRAAYSALLLKREGPMAAAPAFTARWGLHFP
ncbi:transcriptional regulator domain-containing protein [Sphingobium sp. Cam5-1]|uniref:transcriptional regulator domain-containing protein n=1 Tax=Sphingobium sp. Cam5-1 TaxID=2789327 RepID=UPI0018AD1AA2|nr:DUF6499 domain-containing protein [Sphingobium sp. Cam5-1]QPI71958.1 hypothetical protein IZV00_08470 [Sphingobium sp. Cam5-1]